MTDFLLLIIILIFLIAFVLIISKVAKNKNCNFDERQEIIRGRAFKYAYFAYLIYGAGYGAVSSLLEKDFMTTPTALLVGMYISLIIFAVYNIWNEAFFAFNQKPVSYILIFSITTISSGLSGIDSIIDGSIIENGSLTLDCIGVISSIAFATILITMLIKIIVNKKAEQEG
ncbi:MAG: hypothetical protein UHK60_01920 [Acutalibacteraceae bacterium]|nr:hypothetical protein [Acutalibacteraceae bacterium]